MSSLEPGTRVGRYRVTRLIARGGMAEVYRAEQSLAGGILRAVALKVIRPEYAQSEDFREMFLDEARTACTLSHPNIVPIHEVGEEDGRLYMAMELVAGESLASVAQALWERGEQLPDEALLAVGISTCSALETVHARPQLVHRDVSPQNLLLTSGGVLKLIDFGIAKAASNRNLTRAGTTKGKVGYFSPEQAQGKPLDGRSDLFSLGVTLYQLASGRVPLEGHASLGERHTALVKGQWAPLSRVCPDRVPGLLAAVERTLRVKREERPAHARALREELEAAALAAGLSVGPGALAGYVRDEGEGVSLAPSPPRRTRVNPSGAQPNVTALRTGFARLARYRRLELPVAGVGLGLLLSLGTAALLLRSPPPPPATAPTPARTQPEAPTEPSPPPASSSPPAPSPTPLGVAVAPLVRPTLPEPPPSVMRADKGKREPKHSREPAPAAAPPPASEPPLEGEGDLRLGTSPTLVGKASVRLPHREREELPVVLRHWKAGPYSLEFSSSEGTVHCDVTVLPEQRTVVLFDGRGCKVSH